MTEVNNMHISKKIVLTFPHQLVDKPIVYHLIKDFDLTFNILKANITPEEEGLMVMEISGSEENYRKGLDFLKNAGVEVKPLKTEVKWLEDKCTQCSACITICPTEAMQIDRKTMRITFDEEKCISCELCVKPCPPRAFEVK
jgi:ferredoxin